MESKRITAALACILAAACVIVTVILVSVNRKINYLPESAVADIVAVLEAEDIRISPELIDTKREKRDVYVFSFEEYGDTVARRLGGNNISSKFTTPSGEIIQTDDGQLLEFGDGFYFRYSRDGERHIFPLTEQLSAGTQISPSLKKEISDAAVKFLDSGSRDQSFGSQMSIVTSVDAVCEYDGVYYAVCSRTIDGVRITDNTVVCAYSGGAVSDAEGVWCFFVEAEPYSAQLIDHLNILFNVKRDMPRTGDGQITITSISLCYSLYYYGDGDDFCLIPCWQVTTDTAGELIYNALDGTLYTK